MTTQSKRQAIAEAIDPWAWDEIRLKWKSSEASQRRQWSLEMADRVIEAIERLEA